MVLCALKPAIAQGGPAIPDKQHPFVGQRKVEFQQQSVEPEDTRDEEFVEAMAKAAIARRRMQENIDRMRQGQTPVNT